MKIQLVFVITCVLGVLSAPLAMADLGMNAIQPAYDSITKAQDIEFYENIAMQTDSTKMDKAQVDQLAVEKAAKEKHLDELRAKFNVPSNLSNDMRFLSDLEFLSTKFSGNVECDLEEDSRLTITFETGIHTFFYSDQIPVVLKALKLSKSGCEEGKSVTLKGTNSNEDGTEG